MLLVVYLTASWCSWYLTVCPTLLGVLTISCSITIWHVHKLENFTHLYQISHMIPLSPWLPSLLSPFTCSLVCALRKQKVQPGDEATVFCCYGTVKLSDCSLHALLTCCRVKLGRHHSLPWDAGAGESVTPLIPYTCSSLSVYLGWRWQGMRKMTQIAGTWFGSGRAESTASK